MIFCFSDAYDAFTNLIIQIIPFVSSALWNVENLVFWEGNVVSTGK
jgi:hypothetical protein